LLGGHKSGFLGGKVDARPVSDAQFVTVEGEPVDSEPHTRRVEKDVAGMQDGVVKVHYPVRRSAFFGEIDPALELAAIECSVSGTICGEALWRIVIFEHRRGGNDLKNRTRRELRLD